MSEFYVKAEDEQKCRASAVGLQEITITGLTNEGELREFIGVVRSLENGHSRFPGYPLRITMPNAAEFTLRRV